MNKRLLLGCCAVIVFSLASSSLLAAGTDALLQAAAKDYAAMKDSLVKKYEEQYKRGEELDHKYRQQNRKDTIRNQVQAWQSILADGSDALSGFVTSEDFDKAHIVYYDYYFRQAFSELMRYKDSWAEEIGPALSAVKGCCNTDDINECTAQLYEKASPPIRDFANKIEEQIGGFFRSVDQSKLGYYDDYHKKTQKFTYTWPKNAERLLNFLKGDSEWDRRSRRMDQPGLNSASLLTVNLRSNEGRLLDMYVMLAVQNYSSGSAEHFWLRQILEDASVIEKGGNYLVLKREGSYYRLVHFFKGRKSLAMVYTINSDKTVDAMVRYLILALRDYVVSGATPGAAPQPNEGPAPARQMEVDPLTSTNLQTSPGPESTCTLQVVVADPSGAPAANAAVVFEKPQRGTLSALQLATDAQGKAQVTYTAPTEDQMAQAGKKEASVTLTAREQKSGAQGSVTLNIRSRTSTMTAQVEHAILPAHPKYYNTIRFRFQAANKKDGSPYQARITAYQQWGALVKDKLQQGGTPSYEMAVWPNSDCAVSYHWVGPASMMRAADEIITVEIPELGLKQEVTFSVGIDLAIVSVRRAYGEALLPLLWEPFQITITDRFHPDADLAALLERFHITTDLEIKQIFYSPPPVAPADTGFLSALLTKIEGAGKSLRDAVIWDAGGWGVQKQQDKRCILIQKGEYEDGAPWIEYPSIVFWERGSYQFQVTLKPGPVNADPRTNLALTEVYTIEDFRGMGDEVIHTVFLPSIEFVAGALAGYAESLPLKFAFCLKGLAGDIHSGSYTGFLLDAWGCGMDVIGALKLPARVKELFDDHLLALYAKTLCDTLVGNAPPAPATTKGPPGQAKAVTTVQPSTRYDLAKILEIAQLAVKGSKGSYLIILERTGLERYTAEIGGEALTPAPAKLSADQSPAQRIEEGERFIVIPAAKDEKIIIQLNGHGGPGKLILVTENAVNRYAYPSSVWGSTVAVDCSGKATITHGDILTPAP